jgi:hypothetical protein
MSRRTAPSTTLPCGTNTNLVDIVSLTDDEGSDGEPICFTNNDENSGLPVIQDDTDVDPRSGSESSREIGTYQATSHEAFQSEAPQSITLQQVMMTEPDTTNRSWRG